MVNQTYSQWVPIFFSCLRRGPLSKKYIYRNNIWYIKQHIKGEKAALIEHIKESGIVPIDNVTIYSNKSFSQIPLDKVKTVILTDIMKHNENGKRNILFKFDRTDTSYGKLIRKENNWNAIERLLSSTIKNNSSLEDTRQGNRLKRIPPFSYRYTITLPVEISSQNKEAKHSTIIKSLDILWTEPVYSNFIIGIGLKPPLFEVLNNSSVKIIHPISRKPLKLYELNENDASPEAIAICPKYNLEQRKIKGIDLLTSICPYRLCEGEDREIIIKLIKSNSPNSSSKKFEAVISSFNEGKSKLMYNNDLKIINLESLLADSSKHNYLWGKHSDSDRDCPSDIIRSVLISGKYELPQIKEEFMKHFTVFNMFSFIWRYQPDLQKLHYFNENDIKPWSRYILKEYHKINELPLYSTVEEVTISKIRFDEFLQKVYLYYYFIVCELKSSNSGFHSLPDSLQSLVMLKHILTQCKWFEIFYPNLHSFFQNRIPLTEANKTITNEINNASTRLSTEERQLVDTIRSLLYALIETETIIYQDKFPKDGKALYQLKQIDSKSWKIVLLSKKNILSEEVQNIIKYSLPIPIHFVKSLERSKQFENYVCIKKKMINEDLFLYLRKLENTPQPLMSDINSTLNRVLKSH
ncbi:hypothetical protein C6P44_000723 [Monosporozyma unispora]|nr:hypothetical protein C6P44_000723 [Kazachstania unispora]